MQRELMEECIEREIQGNLLNTKGNVSKDNTEEKVGISEETLKEKAPRKTRKALVSFVIKTCCIVVVIYLILVYVIMIHRVSGNSMFPSLRDGDFCIFNRMSAIKSDDVVAYLDDNGEVKTGRIVATPGQEVNFMENGGYEINGVSVYDKAPYDTFRAKSKIVKYPLTLQSNEYFVLNDFRTDTKDSREIGVVHKERIKGTLLFLFRKREF